MNALNLRLGLILLLLCRCSLESQMPVQEKESSEDAAIVSDGSWSADLSKNADMSSPPMPAQRIVTEKWHIEDGNAIDVPGMLYDTKLGVQCVFVADPKGTTRCLPYDPLDSGLSIQYIDSGCTSPVATVTLPLCVSHTYRYVLRGVPDPSCAGRYTYIPYIVGAPLSPMSVWTGTPKNCVVGTTTSVLYSLTPAPLTDFITATLY